MWAGMCSYAELCDGSLTVIELMEMHRSLNLKDHLEAQARKDK